MPIKKKAPMPKSPEKRKAPSVSPAPEGTNGQATRRTGAPVSAPHNSQMAAFEEGMRHFHARQFQTALESFRTAAGGPDRSVTHRASLHARMCESRLGAATVVLNTPEDHYNYAVTLINSRDLAGALKHLHTAIEGAPDADHVLYAMAACQSLAGDLPGAYENLKRAIDLQPSNRLAARQDPDFAGIANQPAIAHLLYPDRK